MSPPGRRVLGSHTRSSAGLRPPPSKATGEAAHQGRSQDDRFAGPAGAEVSRGCQRAPPRRKADASPAIGTGRDRPAGGRGDRGGPRGSAGAAARRHGGSGPGPHGDTPESSRRGPDRRPRKRRRRLDTSGMPAGEGRSRRRAGPPALVRYRGCRQTRRTRKAGGSMRSEYTSELWIC